ncbi:hypothetical protein O1M63_06670 [Streptomyces mirabilis]|nr:hypothetical protein [Streptomyces mirabilis]
MACLQFAPDGAGRLNGVRLTHRNLLAGAAQTALAHRLGPPPSSSTTCRSTTPCTSTRPSTPGPGRCCAPARIPSGRWKQPRGPGPPTYAPPARLHRLAGDPRLGAAGARTGARRLSALHVSGGALEPDRARRLRDELRVPVLQGYGLTEVCTLSHHQPPGSRPGLGAVGCRCRAPSAGSSCRAARGPRRCGRPARCRSAGPS